MFVFWVFDVHPFSVQRSSFQYFHSFCQHKFRFNLFQAHIVAVTGRIAVIISGYQGEHERPRKRFRAFLSIGPYSIGVSGP